VSEIAHIPTRIPLATTIEVSVRPSVKGKFIFVGDEKLYVRGVTYGPFHPTKDGSEYHCPEAVKRDFAVMAENGINAVRTYTVPPRWLLDTAQRHGLHVMVGLPWEQHITFLDDRKRAQAIENRVRVGVRACAGHPAVLCYTVGNEIPASIVRWYGRRRVERFLERLYRAAKTEDPDSLVTYVSYPTTEYLQLPFIDLVCFNVYLESEERLAAYLTRLQNIAGERPLIMAEVGLDSRRHGEETQANVLEWQVRTTFTTGCAGTFVFAWTDEWHRGGHDIEDWDFGLTDRDRNPKPALVAVQEAYADVPFPKHQSWPRISTVVCTYNGSRTIRDCCEGLLELDYPNFEVIVVNDGSNDSTPAIVEEYGFRLITTENRGLSNARNTGFEASTGEIVAYIDDDARPDPHWLTYLAATFMNSEHVGVGGPNIAPPGDGPIAESVADAPGGPAHVLLSDGEAEHIPGCNMAFRKDALQAVGGFDPQFRIAGDDVDICWKLQERGWTLGFNPAAMVWHHCRDSVKAYFKQQFNYGKAEALLELKWPQKYNPFGHQTWEGRMYGPRHSPILPFLKQRVYYGVWGSRLFQSDLERTPSTLQWLPVMPEWYLVVFCLGGLSALGVLWRPLLFILPFFAVSVAMPAIQNAWHVAQIVFPKTSGSRLDQLKRYALTTFLFLAQPLVRLLGRLRFGLTPWRRHSASSFAVPRSRQFAIWSEHWRSADQWLTAVEAELCNHGAVVVRGGNFDRWDLQVRGGLFGTVRTQLTIEEHGAGRQLVRLRSWLRFTSLGVILTVLSAVLLVLALLAALNQAWVPAVIIGAIAILLGPQSIVDCAAATRSVMLALQRLGDSDAAKRTALQPIMRVETEEG
jgi:GT2 family glycosyltransferase